MIANRLRGSVKASGANQLTVAVIKWLSDNGWSAWRNNTMGVFDPKVAGSVVLELVVAAVKRKHEPGPKFPKKASALLWEWLKSGSRYPSVKTVRQLLSACYRKSHERKGAPDVLAYHKRLGYFLGIEVKFGKDQVSPEQMYFLQSLNRSRSGRGLVVRSWSDFIEQYCEKVAPVIAEDCTDR